MVVILSSLLKFVFYFRSVTLVGEKERKLLKEVVKKARTPLKTRIVPQGLEVSCTLHGTTLFVLKPTLSHFSQKVCCFKEKSDHSILSNIFVCRYW